MTDPSQRGETGPRRRSQPQPWVPLAVRSHFSFLRSTLSPTHIIQRAREEGFDAIALCDLGNLHGAVEFLTAARAAGVTPLLGAELEIDRQSLWLFVESTPGYANLCRILSDPCPPLEPPRRQPSTPPPRDAREDNAHGIEESTEPHPATTSTARYRRTRDDLDQTTGLIAVSPDLSLASRFPGRFYRALTTRSSLRQYNPAAPPPAIPMVPVCYDNPTDRPQFDILESIRTLTLLRQAHPDKRTGGRYHFRTAREYAALFEGHPSLERHARELADRCRFQFPFGPPQFPKCTGPDGSPARVRLRDLVLRGARARYPGPRPTPPLSQIEEELRIIAEVGYEDYFLTVWELLQSCREQGIDWITRGSAADSLVCYCLGISNVCPVRFDLYFRRFLNPERMALHKLPDIDIDFPHDRKDDVLDLLFARHGSRHCAVVGGFSTYQARGAVGDIAKVLGLSERQIRRITEHFPWGAAGNLRERLRAIPECQDLPLDEEPYRTALDLAATLDGVPRYAKMHPCGVVLSGQPMHELTPTFQSPKGYPTTHFDMDAVEAVGLVKLDILAQGGLSVMRDVRQSLRREGCDLDLDTLEVRPQPAGTPAARSNTFQDPDVWDLISSGQARAVHHIESPAMTSLCRMCNVRDIDTLIAIVSVIRPGAANEDKKREFTRRYQGLSPARYAHPSIEPCLKSTFGLVVYEEHVLQICEAFAGLPGGRADLLRRALVKEQWDKVESLALEFANAARARGRSEAEIREVWSLIVGFHGYAFCKAHSTAYGVEAYQSAWLKSRFPAHYMAAVLTHGKGFYRPLVYVLESHRLGIPLLPPCVNDPGPGYAVRPNPAAPSPRSAIRVPIAAIQSLTRAAADRLLAERTLGPFASIADLFLRVRPAPDELETLCRAGAFDGFGQSRCAQFWEIQQIVASHRGPGTPGQRWLLDPPSPARTLFGPDATDAEALTEPTRQQRLVWETELLGFPASDHPLALYPDVAWDSYCPAARLGEYVGETVTLCGLIIEDRVHRQAGGEPMKFLTLADWTGMVETELFAPTYKAHGLATVRYPVLEVTGRVEGFENGRGCTLRVLRAGKPRRRFAPR
ncbi:MAG TPA: DNA polymerase III subunit alpha [Verrucomicrobiota bacterium]|nr:DNA polymerase III subunit alpha [Verrucomicrobiota bacterium]HNU52586.1 DNA polymerase III subunit alpha [Verrucomicrobiota bacterium]